MIYSENQYIELSRRFNSQSFTQKLITIRDNPNIFTLESDGYNCFLRLEFQAMVLEVDLLFNFPQTLDYEHLKAIFSLIDLSVKELK